MKIQLRGETFILDPTGAMFHPESSALIVADLHLGKISHFRKHGFAVPSAAKNATLFKLDETIRKYSPETLVLLGDLFHSDSNSEWADFVNWRMTQAAEVILVEGNHDIMTVTDYGHAKIHLVSRLETKELTFTHEPEIFPGKLTVCGHIHPGIRLSAQGDQHAVLPCFYETRNWFILPAFGDFTGKFLLDPNEAERVFVVAGQKVLPLDPAAI